MYLKSDRITIKLGGLTFLVSTVKPVLIDGVYNSAHVPEYQYILDPTAIEGWYDGASVRRSGAERPNQWGDFAEIGRKGSRIITLSGSAITKSEGAEGIKSLQKARDEFTGLLQGGGYHRMEVMSHPTDMAIAQDLSGGIPGGIEYRTISVSLNGSPSWVRMSDNIAVWKLELYAPDPRIYGEVKNEKLMGHSNLGGLMYPLQYPINFNNPAADPSITIKNNGNVDAWPVYVVSGEYPAGFRITDGLRGGITYNGAVTFASPVEIDSGRGTAMQNGVDRSTELSQRDWFPIPPKQTIRPVFDPIPTTSSGILLGSCDIMFNDTWI